MSRNVRKCPLLSDFASMQNRQIPCCTSFTFSGLCTYGHFDYGSRSMLKRTPFHDFHQQSGAKLVEYNGWEMPLLYRGIVDEHQQTRTSGSIFDVSHMGRMQFSGKDAGRFLDRVLTRAVNDQKVGQSRYSLVCNEAGGVLDD